MTDDFKNDPTGRKNEDTNVTRRHQFNREFLMGPLNNNARTKFDHQFEYCATPVCHSFFLFARPPQRLRFYYENENYGGVVSGLTCDNDLIEIGAPYRTGESIELEAKSDFFLCFQSVTVQYMIFDVGAYDGRYACINYIRLVTDGGEVFELGKLESVPDASDDDEEYSTKEVTAVGNKNNFGEDDRKVKAHYFQPVTEEGRLFLKGAAFCVKGLLFLQFVDLTDIHWRKDAENSLLDFYRFSPTQGVFEPGNVTDHYNDVVFGHHPALEDTHTLTNWHVLFVTGCGSLGVSDPRPFILGKYMMMIEKCLDGDLAVLTSICTIQHFLDHVIQTKAQTNEIELKGDGVNDGLIQEEFNGKYGYKFLTKSRQYWYPLYRVSRQIKRINHYSPNFDCYTVAYLDSTFFNTLQAVLVFGTQMSLFGMVVSSVDNDNIRYIGDLENSYPSVIIATLIFAIVSFIVKHSMTNFAGFLKAFPEATYSLPIILGFTINVVLALLILPLNFIIIASTKDRFDLVVNSVALLFIIELDNQIIDLGQFEKRALHLSYVRAKLQEFFQTINPKCHTINTWTTTSVRVNNVECDFHYE